MEHRATVVDDDDIKKFSIPEIDSYAALGTAPSQLQESDFDDPFLAPAADLLKIENFNQTNFQTLLDRCRILIKSRV